MKSDFDPNQTSVDFRTLGELVHQQHVAQSLFESEIVPGEAPIVDEPAAPAPKKKLPPPPTGDPDVAAQLKAKALAKSTHAAGPDWIAIGVAVALVAVVALLRFLVD